VDNVFGENNKVISRVYAGMVMLSVALSLPLFAQTSSEVKETSPITTLGSAYQNSIELLRNRFRIDHNVNEVTMVFFREFGSSPIVLVRPDGSKIFQSQADGERIAWYDSETYDMIHIKNPVPGPWQAVGQILKDSRVMVLSDIKLHAQSLPPIIFSGEILKQTARLSNGGEQIDYGPFRDIVQLTIELVSTNNPNFDNFGAPTEEIARYEDDGRGMDERPLDGEFTGQFNLSIAAGEWQPIFRVTTPMFTREQVDPVVQLFPTPIIVKEELNGGGENYHKLVIDANRELVDIDSLLIDGKIRFPNGDIQNFSLTEPSDEAREHMIVAFEDGIFRVKLTAYGKTVNGRDFIIDVPEYTFLAKTEQQQQDETGTSQLDEQTEGAANSTKDEFTEQGEDSAMQTLPAPEEEPFPLSLIIWINIAILLVGAFTIVVILMIRNGLPSWLLKPLALFNKKPKSLEGD
jgi:uncharacterized protein (TIGR03503 family)